LLRLIDGEKDTLLPPELARRFREASTESRPATRKPTTEKVLSNYSEVKTR